MLSILFGYRNLSTNATGISTVSKHVKSMEARMNAQHACLVKRRTYYDDAEREWFYSIDAAEHMPVLSPKRYSIRIEAFDRRKKTFPIYDKWQCPL